MCFGMQGSFIIKDIHPHGFWLWIFSSPWGSLPTEITKALVCKIGTGYIEERNWGFFKSCFTIGSSNLTSWTLPCRLSCFHSRSVRVAGIFLWQWLMFNIQEQWTGMYVFTLLFHQGLSFYSCPISVCFHFYYSLQFKQEKESCRNPRARWSFVCMLVEELGYLYVYLMVPVAETELFWP